MKITCNCGMSIECDDRAYSRDMHELMLSFIESHKLCRGSEFVPAAWPPKPNSGNDSPNEGNKEGIVPQPPPGPLVTRILHTDGTISNPLDDSITKGQV